MKPLIFVSALLAAATLSAQSEKNATGLARIAKIDRSGTAWSVRVPDGPLVWTGLVMAAENSADARLQADRALDALRAALAAAGAELSGVVRLNAYVATDTAIPAVEAAVIARFMASPPAFALIRTPLPRAGATIALEAVATTTRAARGVEMLNPLVTVMPAGGKLFISGQAERGSDLASGVKLTMAGLQRTLAHYGLGKRDVVQVKAFIQPFADHAIATREIAASFEGGPVPAIVLMEWVSDLHAEIELVAWAPKMAAPTGDNISYSWLPWLTNSPRYSRAAFVPAGTPLIFIGGINGGDGQDPRMQMKTIFERLGSVLFDAGSSYRNLAKATYYLADPKTRAVLGDIRGVYFDPARPPAASALGVTTLGYPGRAAVIDMIAVPVK